jgi:hypothetical protein
MIGKWDWILVTAVRLLAQAGYREIFDLGGIIDWRAQGFPVR